MGAGANLVNTERPGSWSANRTRPLCAPEAGTDNGTGDAERFSLQLMGIENGKPGWCRLFVWTIE